MDTGDFCAVFSVSEYVWWKHKLIPRRGKIGRRKPRKDAWFFPCEVHPKGAFHGSEQLYTAISLHKTI